MRGRRKAAARPEKARRRETASSLLYSGVRRKATKILAARRPALFAHCPLTHHVAHSGQTLTTIGQDFRFLKNEPFIGWLTSNWPIHDEPYIVKSSSVILCTPI